MVRTNVVDRIIADRKAANQDQQSPAAAGPGSQLAGKTPKAVAQLPKVKGEKNSESIDSLSVSNDAPSKRDLSPTRINATKRENADLPEIVLQGVAAAILERSSAQASTDNPSSFTNVRWLFDESEERSDALSADLLQLHAALVHFSDQKSQSHRSKKNRRSATNSEINQETSPTVYSGPASKRSSILRSPCMPQSPNGGASFVVQSLSAPGPRPKSVRISEEQDEMRTYERDSTGIQFINREKRSGFLAVEGRLGLRFPTPNTTMQEDFQREALFMHTFPDFSSTARSGKKEFRSANSRQHASGEPQYIQIKTPAPNDIAHLRKSHPMRGQTPSRMGFAGNKLQEMAYYTYQIPSQLQLRDDDMVSHSPVQTRADHVVYEAKKRAMALAKLDQEKRELAKPTQPNKDLEEDAEVCNIMTQELIRQGLLPKPKDNTSPKNLKLYMSFEEMHKRLEDAEKQKFERLVKMVEKDLVSEQIKWGPHSKCHARLETMRTSPDRRASLEEFVKRELPMLRKQEMADFYKVDHLARNRRCVSQMSMEKEQERKLQSERRAASVPPTLESGRERLLQQEDILRMSKRRKELFLEIQEKKRSTREAMQRQVEHKRAVAELGEYERSMRIREKSEHLRNQSAKSVITALLVVCFVIKMHPKGGKLVPKKKTNVKFVVRIQRWWRLILQLSRDPLNNMSIKDYLDKKEDKLLARARYMVHMWQKAKYVGAIAHFLRDLRDVHQDVVRAVNAKYVAARVIQKTARAFIMSRKTTWVVWEMQWLTFERARNRALIQKWKTAWRQTMQEISKVVKVIPGQPQKRTSSKANKWVGSMMDNFIASLPEEVKNIIDVPSSIRRYVLALHKLKLVRNLVLQLDEHKRIVRQKQADRKVLNELMDTFPHLANMDLSSSPELAFLQEVDQVPPVPHLPLALKQTVLQDLLIHAQRLARGKEERPTSPPEDEVLKVIPRFLDHLRVNGMSLDDAKDSSESATIGKYLGRNSGLSKNLTNQCSRSSPGASPRSKSPTSPSSPGRV